MKRTIWGALLMMAGASVPAFAGAVYVPFATNSQLGGLRLQTQVWVTNKQTAAQSFSTFYVDNDADGTSRGTGGTSQIQLNPGVTQLLGPLTTDGKTGLLEISGNPGFFVNARLTASTGYAVDVPVISSDNVLSSGATAIVPGLARTANRLSQYGLVNVGTQAAQCTVKLSKVNGVAIGAAATITVKPLSSLVFGDPLAPDTQADGVRASASCNQPFYAYAFTVDLQSGEMTFSGPATTAASTLSPPVPGGTAQTFERSGTFFTPAKATPVMQLALPFTKGVNYKKARVQMDVTHGGWYPQQTDGIHNLFLLAIGNDDNRLGYVSARGPGRNFVFFHHTYGLPLGSAGNRVEADGVELQPGQTYHVDYTYDLVAKLITLVITRGGTEVVRLTDSPFATANFRADGSDTFYMKFGLAPANPHAPTYGWKYSNLKVDFTP